MPGRPPKRLNRAHLPAAEREIRSRLAQLIVSRGFARGSISVRERTCGRPNCRCARGELHTGVYLVASENGKLRQLYIPKTLVATAEEWAESYRLIRDLLEELSQLQWDKLKRREP
jgi:hypothetical protein